MLISKLKNSTPKLMCTGPGPTNTRDEVMVTGEYLGCTGTPATLDTSHHNNHHARTIIITTHITTSVSSYPLPSSAAMSWSCGVVSTRHVSWVSGQWPVSTIDRNNTDPDHGEIIYGDNSWIEDDCPDTFSEFIFLFPPAAALCHDFSLVDSVET